MTPVYHFLIDRSATNTYRVLKLAATLGACFQVFGPAAGTAVGRRFEGRDTDFHLNLIADVGESGMIRLSVFADISVNFGHAVESCGKAERNYGSTIKKSAHDVVKIESIALERLGIATDGIHQRIKAAQTGEVEGFDRAAANASGQIRRLTSFGDAIQQQVRQGSGSNE